MEKMKTETIQIKQATRARQLACQKRKEQKLTSVPAKSLAKALMLTYLELDN